MFLHRKILINLAYIFYCMQIYSFLQGAIGAANK